MGADDKIRHAVDKTVGKVKEGVGRVTDNPGLEAEGERDQTKANLGKATENVKDAVRD